MAKGDVIVFDWFKQNKGRAVHNMHTSAFKLGLITDAVTPTAATADPRWGAGGTTNFATNQVTPGGNYANGGPTIDNTTYALDDARAVFDGDPVEIAQNASNPNNARWAILYDDTTSGKQAVLAVDLGGVVDLTGGDFSVIWDALGIYDLDTAP